MRIFFFWWLGVGLALAEISIESRPFAWEQVDAEASITFHAERERYTTLDRDGRFVVAMQVGKNGADLHELEMEWSMRRGEEVLAKGVRPMEKGLVSFDFDLRQLPPGRYDVLARIEGIGEGSDFFTIEETVAPKQEGRIPLMLPVGIPEAGGTWPIHFGVPFPKGVLFDSVRVRLVDSEGKRYPVGTVVRSRWGHGDASSIRWLGVDANLPAGDEAYFLEFGADGAAPEQMLQVSDEEGGFLVDTGPLRFRAGSGRLFEEVTLNGEPVSGNAGAYLVDHEGSIYRAANDPNVKVSLEEQTPLRAVLRVEGWFVKEGTDGARTDFRLPTDRLCRFITRIETYAGKPFVRVLHTWIVTFDSFEVRLRDVGLSLPVSNAEAVKFGVENGEPVEVVTGEGVRLLQHRPDRFDIERGDGTIVEFGLRSDGTVQAGIGVGLRETWQRFPKEFEVLPDELRLHFWPAHGRERHPDIDPYAKDRLHQQWYNHQGEELDLKVPWQALFAYGKIEREESFGIYEPLGNIMAGVHSSAMGVAQTHDVLVHFGGVDEETQRRQLLAHQKAPHVLADPEWLNETKALGHVHPRDPEKFPVFEQILEDFQKGYWAIQDETGEFGMWLYRAWHHNRYEGDGYWGLYRIYSAGHHHEPLMPWLLYVRSGDPDYLEMARATSRSFSDFMMLHHAEPAYEHKEFAFGQGQLVGSTKHTNGHVLWGGDHAVFGHLTTYKALLAAHYLTGDLRFREVLVDEWQKTILEDRANPEFAKANRIDRVGRDSNNSLGELIELYQLTYDPRLLAWIGPAIERMRQNMKVWGMPVERVMQFDGDSVVRKRLLDACREYRATAGSFEDEHGVFFGHSKAGTFALAQTLAPDENFAAEAYFLAEPAQSAEWARRCRDMEPGGVTYCLIPDYALYVPRILHAIASSSMGEELTKMVVPQPFPVAPQWNNEGTLRVIVKEDQDRAFDVRLNGLVGETGVKVRVIGPDRSQVAARKFETGMGVQKLTVPEDGKIGQYVIFVQCQDKTDRLLVPLTDLPEIYYTSYWAQQSPTRFFTKDANLYGGVLGIRAHKNHTAIFDHTLEKQLAADGPDEAYAHVTVPPEGVWIDAKGRYVHLEDRRPIVMAVNPDRYFEPEPWTLEFSPTRPGEAK